MLSIVKSMSLEGISGYLIEIQSDVAGALPGFDIVRSSRYTSKRS